ncbi:MAG: hypothetical protein AAB037_03495, partial [Chloroflexota bacterium]
ERPAGTWITGRGWDEGKLMQNFHIPTPFRVAAVFAVGYPGRLEDLPPEVQAKEKPSARKSQDEIFFWDDFGQKGRA